MVFSLTAKARQYTEVTSGKAPCSVLARQRVVVQSLLVSGILVLVAVWNGTAAQAQDFQQYRPFELAPGTGEAELPDEPGPATGSDQVLVERLRGIIFLDAAEKVSVGPMEEPFDGIHVDSDGDNLSLLRHPSFSRIARGYLDGPVSILRLNELTRDVILHFRRCGRPVVDVSVPKQDVTDGVVQVVVTEARVGDVVFKGNCRFDDCQLSRGLCTRAGQRLYEPRLMSDLDWINRNPFRDVDLELMPGRAFGLTDVVYNVHEKKMLRGYVGYEDSGVNSTGWDRMIFGSTWGNALGKGHQASYQYTTSGNFQSLRAHGGSYVIPLCNRDDITFQGGYVDVASPLNPPFSQQGKAWQTSFRYNRFLTFSRELERRLSIGFDFKQTNTDLEFGGANVLTTSADIAQIALAYRETRRNDCGMLSLGAEMFISPGEFSPGNSTAAYQPLRALAREDYLYTRLYAEAYRTIPRRLALWGKVTGQLADSNLLGSEQLGFGGWNSVRGYDMRLANGDTGYLVNLELRTQPKSLGLGRNWCKDDQFEAHIFGDLGGARAHRSVAGVAIDQDLYSVGLGFRYHLDDNASVRFDYGWQLSDIPGDQRDGRPHVGAVVIY